jgi:hypothetical protein
MGYVKHKIQKEIEGEIRLFDIPLWVGSSDKTPYIKRIMTRREAAEWVKESPDRRVIMKCKKYEL